jgi:hypothetical protein
MFFVAVTQMPDAVCLLFPVVCFFFFFSANRRTSSGWRLDDLLKKAAFVVYLVARTKTTSVMRDY